MPHVLQQGSPKDAVAPRQKEVILITQHSPFQKGLAQHSACGPCSYLRGKSRAWGDGAADKVPARQTQNLSSESQLPHKKPGTDLSPQLGTGIAVADKNPKKSSNGKQQSESKASVVFLSEA